MSPLNNCNKKDYLFISIENLMLLFLNDYAQTSNEVLKLPTQEFSDFIVPI